MKADTRRQMRKEIKMHFAAHHFVFHSKLAKDIAIVVNVSPERIVRWCNTKNWRKALKMWGYAGDMFVEDYYDYTKSSLTCIYEKWIHQFELADLEPVTYVPILSL